MNNEPPLPTIEVMWQPFSFVRFEIFRDEIRRVQVAMIPAVSKCSFFSDSTRLPLELIHFIVIACIPLKFSFLAYEAEAFLAGFFPVKSSLTESTMYLFLHLGCFV